MNRDLPAVAIDGPADSEADSLAPRHASRRPLRAAAAAVVALALLGGGALSAHADDLDDARDRANRQVSKARQQVEESRQDASSAATKLANSRQQLASAQAQLAITRQKVTAAKIADAAAARKLRKARKDLVAAKAAVAKGKQDIAAQKRLIGQIVTQEYQQHTDLAGVAVVLENDSVADLTNRVQYATTVFDSGQSRMDALKELQTKLEKAKKHQEAVEKRVSEARQDAADQLANTKVLEAQAVQQQASVTALVATNAAYAKAAEKELAADTKAYQASVAERTAVNQRIAARVAAQKAAAERRRKAALEAARLQRIAAEKARAAARAKAKHAKDAAAKQRAATAATRRAASAARSVASQPSSNSSSNSSGGWTRPASGPITSPYGMRFHPVLHYWKLHDGMDFGAGCGTPIRAARSGRVAERYYNAGYGNRLIVDHGSIGGSYYTTAYNHAIRYTVSVGEHVSAGEVIGYVGTTGYSTGCHLHFMVWQNGSLINPARVVS